MRRIIFIALAMIATASFAQQDTQQDSLRVINRLGYNNASKLTIGGYVQIDYNEPDGPTPGKLDVHRLVMLFGYNFSDRVSFLTEIVLLEITLSTSLWLIFSVRVPAAMFVTTER